MAAKSEKSVVRVVEPPCKVDGAIARLVELSDGTGRVETWVDGKWVPGGVTVAAVLKGLPVDDPSGGT